MPFLRTYFHTALAWAAVFFFISCSSNNGHSSLNMPKDAEASLFNTNLMPLDSSGLIDFRASFNSSYFMSGEDASAYLYLEVKSQDYEAPENKRSPLNLSLILDRSGSMGGDKIRYVKEAAKFVVEHLKDKDKFSLITYSNGAEVNFPVANIRDKQLIANKVEQILAAGSTNLSGGLLKGYAEAKSGYERDFTNRVLLLSDGLANRGITASSELQKMAATYLERESISLSTIGVGADFNEDLLLSMSEEGSGNYYFIESADEIPSIFSKELKGLLSVVAQSAELSVKLPESVKVDKVFAHTYKVENGVLKVAFQDIFANETKGLLIKLDLSETSQRTLGFESKFRYTDVSQDYKEEELILNLSIDATLDSALYKKHSSAEVEQLITFYRSNERLEQAMEELDKGKYEDAKETLKMNKLYLQKRKRSYGSNQLLEKQDSIVNAYEEKSKTGSEMSDYERKMMQKKAKSENYRLRKQKMK